MSVTTLLRLAPHGIVPVGLLLLVGLCAGIPAVHAAPLVLKQEQKQTLAGHLENLVDKSGSLTLAEILTGPVAQRFEHLPGFVNRGYLAGASWTRFSYVTQNGTLTDWYLRLVPAFLDDVRVYVQKGSDSTSPKSYQEYQLGDHFPMAGRPVKNMDMATPIPSSTDGLPRTVYIRVASSSTHNLQGWLYPAGEFLTWAGEYALILGIMLGVFVILIVANGCYALLLLRTDFGYGTLYLATNLARQLGLDGALFIFWPTGAHYVNDYLVGGGTSLGVSAFSLLTSHLFDTRKRHPRYHRYLQANILIGVATALSIPLGWYGRLAPLMIWCYLILACVTPLLAFGQMRRKVPGSGLLMLAFSVILLPVIPRFLSVLGLIPATWVTTNAYIFGLLIQGVAMTMALVERLHVTREQLLSVTRQAEARAMDLAEERTRDLVAKQQELEQTLEHERRFLDMISHEFRTPLAIVNANLYNITHYHVPPDSLLAGSLAKIRIGFQRMSELFASSLEHSRLRHTLPKLAPQPLDLTSLVAAVVEEARTIWSNRDITVITPPATCVINGDYGLLRTALLNLVINAAKYSPPESPILVALHSGASGTILEVKDHGPGIAPGERDRLFGKYQRGSTSAGTSGLGVGLWLVKHIIEEHGGVITLEENELQGTVARIILQTVVSE